MSKRDFSKYNFSVIDVTVAGVPEMSVNLNGITFNGKTLEVLGNPDYVRPLLDEGNKAFAVLVCTARESKAMRFTKNDGANGGGGYSSTCTSIRKSIRHLMDDAWKDNMRYVITGVYFPEAKAVVFDLESAQELPSFRGGGKGKKAE